MGHHCAVAYGTVEWHMGKWSRHMGHIVAHGTRNCIMDLPRLHTRLFSQPFLLSRLFSQQMIFALSTVFTAIFALSTVFTANFACFFPVLLRLHS